MIQFPVLRRLSVDGYSMYPGPNPGDGLDAQFAAGLTLVIGANGLGKSTLVALIHRLMAGNAEIRGLGFGAMGSGQIDVRELGIQEVRTFVNRVDDGARDASATIEFSLGSRVVLASRSLATLTLTSLVVDDEALEAEETEYRRVVVEGSGVDAFLSWLLILRYLVFYSDDRRSLVWDPSVQRRLLPLLFLPPSETQPIEELTNRILRTDSEARNLSAALTRRERDLREQEHAISSMPTLLGELDELLATRSELEEQSRTLESAIVDAEAVRAGARLEALRRSDEELSITAELDQARTAEIRAAFPRSDETATYILTHLLTERDCLVCGQAAPAAAEMMTARLALHRCVVCESNLDGYLASSEALAAAGDARERREHARLARMEAESFREEAEKAYAKTFGELARAKSELATVSARISRLEQALPESDRSVSKLRDGIAELRADNERMKESVVRAKLELSELVDEQNRRLSAYREDIKEAFETHATGFLVESCELIWGSNLEKIGQLGSGIEYSVFQVDMTAGGRGMATRREDASQVSESQREFIDLAFRMALISVAGSSGTGSLVVDAPESSLDAVFAPRAADVLASFRGADGTARVVITSNLVDGQLIPKLASLAGIHSVNDTRIVNLFEIATPTAAIRLLKPQYDAALARIFSAPGVGPA